jgi:phage I-like protein
VSGTHVRVATLAAADLAVDPPSRGPAFTERADLATLARPIALLSDGATEPPKELRLFAAGFIETTKGVFKFDDESCSSVMRCWQEIGRDYPFDYEHASVFAMFATDPAEAGKAAGWFKPEVRNGECWATGIEWTPKAREKILAKEFRYTSPTFRHDDESRVLELYACALTNDPATKGAKPVINHRGPAAAPASPSGDEKETHMLKLLAARLGLPDTSTEAEVVAALSRHQDKARADADAIAALVALSDKSTVNEASGVFQAWKAGAEQVTALSAKVSDLSAKLDAVEKAKLEVEIDTLVKGAVAAGKLPPANEKLAREMGAKDIAMLRAWVEALPVVVTPSGSEKKPDDKSGPAITLSDEHKAIAAKLGVDPAKAAATAQAAQVK